jgi:hypothetical protein
VTGDDTDSRDSGAGNAGDASARSRWASRWSLWASGLLFAVYLATATRYVLGGDNAEFITVALDGGVAHPPGYPLFILWLRALRWLPAASPAHAAALATALTGGLALLALSRAARAWGACEAGATMAVATFGAASLALKLATAAEVFMPSAAIVAAIVWLSAPRGPLQGAWRTGALALLAGLALANHYSAVLVAPVGLWGAITGVREAKGARLAATAAGVAAFGAGLLPYAQLVFDAHRATPSTLAWGDPGSWTGLLRHLGRADYVTNALVLSGVPRPLEALGFLASDLLAQTHALPLLLAGVGAWSVARPRAADPVAGAMLVGSALLAGPGFIALFKLDLHALGHVIAERFHLLALLFVALLAGLGLTTLLDRVPRLGRYGLPLAAFVLVGNAALAVPDLALEHAPTVENYLRDTLALAPPRAVLLGTGDHRLFGFAYVQRVLGERGDVDYVAADMLGGSAWYRQRVAARLRLDRPDAQPTEGSIADPRALAALAFQSGRPVLVADLSVQPVLRAFPAYPFGTTLRVLPHGASLPALGRIEEANVAAFANLHDSAPAPRDSWAQGARSDYGRTWSIIADAYERAGDPEGAGRCRARAAAFAPLDARSPAW